MPIDAGLYGLRQKAFATHGRERIQMGLDHLH